MTCKLIYFTNTVFLYYPFFSFFFSFYCYITFFFPPPFQEESAQFLPKTVGDGTVTRSCKDIIFLNTVKLKQKVEAICKAIGVVVGSVSH